MMAQHMVSKVWLEVLTLSLNVARQSLRDEFAKTKRDERETLNGICSRTKKQNGKFLLSKMLTFALKVNWPFSEIDIEANLLHFSTCACGKWICTSHPCSSGNSHFTSTEEYGNYEDMDNQID
jgi:hypothetical protein